MEEKYIDILEEDKIRLERAFYEYTSIKDTLAFLIQSKQISTEGEEYDLQVKKLADYNKVLSDLKNEIAIKYIPADILCQNKYKWQADFSNNRLVITEI